MLQCFDAPARAFVYALALVLGAALGSFLNCAAYRLARGESFVTGRSRCPKCGHALGARDLVPVLSWLFLRGRCRHCGEKISARYPLSEAAFALLTLLCVLRFDLTLLCARNLVLLACLMCLTLTDWDAYLVPDGCLLAAALAWAAAAPFLGESWVWAGKHLLAAIVFGGGLLALSLVMDRVLKRDPLGGGDVKPFALPGLYLGLLGGLFALIFSCVLGLLCARLLRRGAREAFPFAPSIAFAMAGMLLFGDGLTTWYLGLLGF